MTVKQTDDIELRKQIRKQLKANDGYCPCKIDHIPENKCMCREFLNAPIGPCHCGLYIKTQE